jgi:hypothetical protein
MRTTLSAYGQLFVDGVQASSVNANSHVDTAISVRAPAGRSRGQPGLIGSQDVGLFLGGKTGPKLQLPPSGGSGVSGVPPLQAIPAAKRTRPNPTLFTIP